MWFCLKSNIILIFKIIKIFIIYLLMVFFFQHLIFLFFYQFIFLYLIKVYEATFRKFISFIFFITFIFQDEFILEPFLKLLCLILNNHHQLLMANEENVYKFVNFLIPCRLWIIYDVLNLFLYFLKYITVNVNWGQCSNFYLRFLLMQVVDFLYFRFNLGLLSFIKVNLQ